MYRHKAKGVPVLFFWKTEFRVRNVFI